MGESPLFLGKMAKEKMRGDGVILNPEESSSVKTVAIDLKRMNRRRIYNLLRSGTPVSRRDIVMQLNLSLPTVVQNLNELMEDGLICVAGQQNKTGGRRAKTYTSVNDFRTAIGLDVTTHDVGAVAVDLCGHILARKRLKLPFVRSAEYYRNLGRLVDDLALTAGLDLDHVLGVGISVPCLTEKNGTHSYYCKALGGTDELFAWDFAAFTPFPVRLCHDTDTSAFAESWAWPDHGDFFYLMLSNSIGGAVFINGDLYSGDNCRSCEVGHIQLVRDGKRCYCGRSGCADGYCSTKPLAAITGGDVPEFFRRLAEKEPVAKAAWQEYLGYLAQLIHNIHMLYDCKIVLGGQIGQRLETNDLDFLCARLAAMDPFIESADYVTVCKAKVESAAVGAAISFIGQYVSSI